MPKIVVEGPDGRKFAFPDTMPRAEINAFMRQKYGTKAPNETVQDYLARYGREQAATEARAKDIDREATVVGRAEGERAAERMGVDNPLMMAFAAPAIGIAQQEGGRRVFDREGTVLADEAAGLSAANAAAFFVPGMVNKEFGARVEEGRRQQPLAAFAGDVAGGFGPGEIIGAGVSKAVQSIGPGMAALGRMLSRGPGPDAMPAGGYFGRQSMRLPGSGPSPREIEIRQQWSTATPIVTQARTTAQSAAQAADAALQSKAPADIARAKDQKKALVGQLQEAQASRAGMDTPEDARLAETLASLTENTSDPVLLSTQISAAKTSLDRLLTDIGSPVEGNLIPVKTNILTRTQAPRSAAEGPQDRASVTRYAEGSDEIKPQGFGASTPKTPQQAFDNYPLRVAGQRIGGQPEGQVLASFEESRLAAPSDLTERRLRQDVLTLENERASLRAEAQAIEDSVGEPAVAYTPEQADRLGAIDTRLGEIDAGLQNVYTRYSELGYDPATALAEDISLVRFTNKPIDQITAEDVAAYDRAMAGTPAPRSADVVSFAEALRRRKGETLGQEGLNLFDNPLPVEKTETPGSPEYEAAVAKGLDMSQAGRMARAKEMGFDTETVFYRGMRTDGADVSEMRVSTNPENAYGPGVYMTEDAARASIYGGSLTRGGQVFPLVVRGKIAEWDAVDRAMTEALKSGDSRMMERTQDILKSQGYSGLRSFDVPEEGIEVLMFDPANVRSVNAAFDPEKSTSSTLLAAAPFAVVGGASMTAEKELGARMKEKKA